MGDDSSSVRDGGEGAENEGVAFVVEIFAAVGGGEAGLVNGVERNGA